MDKSIFNGMSGLPEEDKQRMSTMVDQLQIRDSLRMYNSLVERCFKDCVDTFYQKSLTKNEETCVLRCAEKFMRLSMQVGSRFSDLDQDSKNKVACRC
ncbi:mitochondrial import inner membrane translocase subunit TIM9-like isoform X2 [Arachis stenosperma]|uniref:mitochondrial import inner membrane translocase subunit TIM9-like isoform X2 n=1 Tax=Arachis stenosperma TaxID=217475 RepID=UPI0025ACD9CC|nr:mitochondrial import inner membrane translocase subunit TIM9-like isoform X2 [Arachis stenosperma]